MFCSSCKSRKKPWISLSVCVWASVASPFGSTGGSCPLWRTETASVGPLPQLLVSAMMTDWSNKSTAFALTNLLHYNLFHPCRRMVRLNACRFILDPCLAHFWLRSPLKNWSLKLCFARKCVTYNLRVSLEAMRVSLLLAFDTMPSPSAEVVSYAVLCYCYCCITRWINLNLLSVYMSTNLPNLLNVWRGSSVSYTTMKTVPPKYAALWPPAELLPPPLPAWNKKGVRVHESRRIRNLRLLRSDVHCSYSARSSVWASVRPSVSVSHFLTGGNNELKTKP